jgi:hypothetical protein
MDGVLGGAHAFGLGVLLAAYAMLAAARGAN